MKKFEQRVLAKIRELSEYLKFISHKSTPIIEANQVIAQALALFVGESCIVQVSSPEKPQLIRNFYIQQYLHNLNLLKYDQVEIEWAEVNFIGDIRKGPDGRHYGTVQFSQLFRGIVDNRVQYGDLTHKKIDFVINGYKEDTHGNSEDLWDVYFPTCRLHIQSLPESGR